MSLRRAIAACALGALLMGAGTADACVNTFKGYVNLKLRRDPDGARKYVAELEATAEKSPTLENMNDAAVGRMLLGHYPRAIKRLKEVERMFPGHAIVAANLGTAYELSGDLDEAMRWISEGVKRDPREHEYSEWLHVEILRARLALSRDPDWLESHSVLGLYTGLGARPLMPSILPVDHEGRVRGIREIEDAITYQLNERMEFVNPPDAVVADLHATSGDLLWLIGRPATYKASRGDPALAYTLALKWGSPRPDLVKLRQAIFAREVPQDDWVPRPIPSEIYFGGKPPNPRIPEARRP